jgi:hypothetical protein
MEMHDAALDADMVRVEATKQRGLLAAVKQRLAEWVAELCAAPEVDPTAQFSGRDWADLPTYHPSEDR